MLLRFLRYHAAKIIGAAAHGAVSPPDIKRRPGSWHHTDIAWMADLVRAVPGDFAEIGVFRGAAFTKLALAAIEQQKIAHAFDSFAGMDEPAPEDGGQYPKGRFDIGGAEKFVQLMNVAGLVPSTYRVWAGYIPACFANVPPEQGFSLVVIDVDHYRPTAASLAWACPRINRGGILALDDFLPASSRLATKAIMEFLARDTRFEELARFNQQLILRKT